MTRSKRTVLVVLIATAAIFAVAGIAWAAGMFPDVAEDDPHFDAIEWAAANGIVNGYTNGNFGPYDGVLRGQAASMFQNYDEYRLESVAARRGCAGCHAGPYAIENELPDGHFAVDGSQYPPADVVDVNDCLTCHGVGKFATPLREVLHPVHLGSKIFGWELMGNCFSCHANNDEGDFLLLPAAVTVDAAGIPEDIPIESAQAIPGPPATE